MVAVAVLAGCGPAATHPTATPKTVAAFTGPHAKVDSEEEYTSTRSDYDALPLDAPARPSLRAALEAYLLRQATQALDGGHLEEAYEALKPALTLYDPEELIGAVKDPALAALAERTEQAFRRRGAHEEVTVSLIVQISLGDAPAAQRRYDELTSWLKSGGVTGSADEGAVIDGRERVIEDLESTARYWPSKFVVDTLTALYLDRQNGDGNLGLFNRKLRRGAELRDLIGGNQRVGLAYELTRLYLRISRPDDASVQLRKLAKQPGDDPTLRQLVDKWASPQATPSDAVLLGQVFIGQGRDDRDVALRVCKDAQKRFPQSGELALWAGKFAFSLEQIGTALRYFELAVKADPQKLEGWEALAKLYQTRLAQVVSDENLNVGELEKQLKRVESFHADALKRFPDKPIRPSMADALFEVGRGYYNAGRLADAEKYLERTIAMSATPQALELLGQIRLKKGQPADSATLFQRATGTAKGDKGDQLWWRAKLRRQLADALDQTDAKAAVEERKAALSDWDVLIGFGLTPEALAESGLEKAKLFYQLGDRDASLDAFGKAIDAAPDRGSTYADVIAYLVTRGELEDALDAYHRALGRNEVSDYLKVYCSLWIVDLARRAGQPEDPLATAYLKSTDGGKWFDDLARWATGRQSEQQLLTRADTPARKAESAFYRAMRLVNAGKLEDARVLWKQVLDTDMMAFFEYDMATFYLKNGGAPSKPILKSKPREDRPAPRAGRPPDGSI